MKHKPLSKQTDEKIGTITWTSWKRVLFSQTIELWGMLQNCYFKDEKTSESL